jgi:NAD(P)-dependent dehydrogenase (short-subunit alcohol dehydrogenase family)
VCSLKFPVLGHTDKKSCKVILIHKVVDMIAAVSTVLVAVTAVLVFLAERQQYKVHSEGIVIITGASTGIGRDATEFLADNFNFVVLAGVRKESDFSAIEKLNKKNLRPLMLDVSSHESCTKAVQEIKSLSDSRSLPLVGLVNNAGVGQYNPVEFQDLDAARAVFDTNFFGLLDLTQQVLPLLRASGGRIVMLSSIGGFVGGPFSGVYAASKFAVEALSDSLRRELQHHNVSVSVIEPGYVRTQLIASSRKSSQEQYNQQEAQLLALYPAVGNPAEMEVMMSTQPGPEVTTTPAIVLALTAAHPKTRYPVAGAAGLSATVIAWIVWLLSDRMEDALFFR